MIAVKVRNGTTSANQQENWLRFSWPIENKCIFSTFFFSFLFGHNRMEFHSIPPLARVKQLPKIAHRIDANLLPIYVYNQINIKWIHLLPYQKLISRSDTMKNWKENNRATTKYCNNMYVHINMRKKIAKIYCLCILYEMKTMSLYPSAHLFIFFISFQYRKCNGIASYRVMWIFQTHFSISVLLYQVIVVL